MTAEISLEEIVAAMDLPHQEGGLVTLEQTEALQIEMWRQLPLEERLG